MHSASKLFYSLVLDTASSVLGFKVCTSKSQAYIPGGVNGPYFDLETPVRNTAHWLISYSILYKLEGDQKFKTVALQLLEFLLQTESYKKGDIYIHRQRGGKDWTNGVIGQAWVTEALGVAGSILEHEVATKKAVDCADSLTFDQKIGAWLRPEIESFKSQIDYTLNHQLWFAAAKAEAAKGKYCPNIESFLTKLNNGALRTRNNGQINHLFYSSSLKGLLLQARYRALEASNKSAVLEKEAGYHLYNLHPLARLKFYYPEHDLFQNQKVKTALGFIKTDTFKYLLFKNGYSYCYNSPGFEFPLINEIFELNTNGLVDYYLGQQLEETWCAESKLFNKNNPDPVTLTARVYEYLLRYKFSELK